MSYPDESNLTQLATLLSYLDPAPPRPSGLGFVEVTNGGSGYSQASPPALTITAAGGDAGTGAVAKAVVNSAGVIVGVVVTSPGANYTLPPVVTPASGAATFAAYIGPDYLLSKLIRGASSSLIDMISIPTIFDSGSNLTEVRNGNGRQRMPMKVSPIISIASLTIKQQYGTFGSSSQPVTVPASDGSSADYLFDDRSIYLVGYVFSKGVQNVTTLYRAGEVLGSHRQLELEQACLDTCVLWWKRRAHMDHVSMSTPSGIGSITFTQKDFPPNVLALIQQLRRVAPVGP